MVKTWRMQNKNVEVVGLKASVPSCSKIFLALMSVTLTTKTLSLQVNLPVRQFDNILSNWYCCRKGKLFLQVLAQS